MAPDNVTIYPVHADPFRYVELPQVVKYLSPVPLAFWRSKEIEKVIRQLAHREKWGAIVAVQAPVARYALRFSHIPCILDVDTSLNYQLRERYQEQRTYVGRLRSWVSWYKAYRYERSLFQKFQACTVVSSLEVMSVQAMTGAGTQVDVIPNGVDCDHHRLGLARAPA